MIKKESRIDILVIIIASMTTILALIISNIFPKLQVLILTILTILLALIYQVGNIYSKETIKAENEKDFLELEIATEELKEERDNIKGKYERLKNKINY